MTAKPTEIAPEELDEIEQRLKTFAANALVDFPRLLTAYREQAAELERLRARVHPVIEIAQATLTALNVGDVQKGSLLHLKLREVMIAYRGELEEQS